MNAKALRKEYTRLMTGTASEVDRAMSLRREYGDCVLTGSSTIDEPVGFRITNPDGSTRVFLELKTASMAFGVKTLGSRLKQGDGSAKHRTPDGLWLYCRRITPADIGGAMYQPRTKSNQNR